MVIQHITSSDVLQNTRVQLDVPPKTDDWLDPPFLAEIVRRAASAYSPCSRLTLRNALLNHFENPELTSDLLAEGVDHAIDALFVGGDLLELSDVITNDAHARGTWIYAAPPSYVIRKSGVIHLIGIVRDMETFVPPYLASRIVREGYLRLLIGDNIEDDEHALIDLGFQKRSLDSWLKSPRPRTALELVQIVQKQLERAPESGTVSNIEILDSSHSVTFYPSRWVSPINQTGMHVARRPQDYGHPLWCVVELKDGEPQRLIHLPLSPSPWRACDHAWHLQMALDAERGTPQNFDTVVMGDKTIIHFFSPLPLWAERRLILIGKPTRHENSLLAFEVPNAEAKQEIEYLQDHLWLAQHDKNERSGEN